MSETVTPDEAGPVLYLPGSFDEFVRAEYRGVLAFARALTASWAEAEDLAQDGFTAAFRKWAAVSRYDRPGAFVRRVVANRAVSELRRRGRDERARSRLPFIEAIESELADPEFWTAVRDLAPQQRQVVVLRYLEDRTIADIADLLQIAPGTVRAHLFAARRNLAAVLGEALGQEEP